MYYSKNNSSSMAIPQNYSGNAFRVIDESDRTYINEPNEINASKATELIMKEEAPNKDKSNDISPLSSIISSISVEDVLLLGLILVIHHDNPHDNILFLLLILLLAK